MRNSFIVNLQQQRFCGLEVERELLTFAVVINRNFAHSTWVGEGITIVQGIFDGLRERIGNEDIIGVVVLADPEIGEIVALYKV